MLHSFISDTLLCKHLNMKQIRKTFSVSISAPTTSILPLAVYYTCSVILSIPLFIHEFILFSSHFKSFANISTTSSNTLACIFFNKTDIKWNAHILGVHSVSFEKYIHLCGPDLYQDTEHYHPLSLESYLIIIPVNLSAPTQGNFCDIVIYKKI